MLHSQVGCPLIVLQTSHEIGCPRIESGRVGFPFRKCSVNASPDDLRQGNAFSICDSPETTRLFFAKLDLCSDHDEIECKHSMM